MTFVLWLCITASSGACGVERSWPMTEAQCTTALARARIVANGAQTNVTSATVVEIESSGNRVVMVCLPKPPIQPATAPTKPK